MLHRTPSRLQQESVLWVHHPDLTRRHAEERRVEARYVLDETRATGDDLAGHAGFWVEECVGVPAILGDLGYRVLAVAQHVPKRVGVRCARETCWIADDCKARGRLDWMCGGCHTVVL